MKSERRRTAEAAVGSMEDSEEVIEEHGMKTVSAFSGMI